MTFCMTVPTGYAPQTLKVLENALPGPKFVRRHQQPVAFGGLIITNRNQSALGVCWHRWFLLECRLCLLSFATSSHHWQHLCRHIRNVIPRGCGAPCVYPLSILLLQ